MPLPFRSRLLGILTVLFVGLPLLDTVTLVVVGRYMGFWWTVATVILSGVIGAHLARQQGFSVWRSLQADLAAGRVPTHGLMDCVLILIAGGMMIAPGFLTDILAILLLLPPVRSVVKRWARFRIERMVRDGSLRIGPAGW